MADITSANTILILNAPSVFAIGQALKGFAADDIFDVDQIKVAEASMGVDGYLSAGFVFEALPQTIMLQADSPSCLIMDQIYAYEEATVSKEVLSATFKFPSIGIQFNLAKGFMTAYSPMASPKRKLEARRFSFMWERAIPGPLVGV
jgi:hypothetical protein